MPSDPSPRPDAEPNEGDRPGRSLAGDAGADLPGRSLAGQPGGEAPDPDVPLLVTTTSFTSPGVRRLAGAAALIAVLTIASRLLGFVRTLVLGKVAIAELSTAYLTANLIPNIIFEIVAGGALASLVVPLVAGAIARRDRSDGRRHRVGADDLGADHPRTARRARRRVRRADRVGAARCRRRRPCGDGRGRDAHAADLRPADPALRHRYRAVRSAPGTSALRVAGAGPAAVQRRRDRHLRRVRSRGAVRGHDCRGQHARTADPRHRYDARRGRAVALAGASGACAAAAMAADRAFRQRGSAQRFRTGRGRCRHRDRAAAHARAGHPPREQRHAARLHLRLHARPDRLPGAVERVRAAGRDIGLPGPGDGVRDRGRTDLPPYVGRRDPQRGRCSRRSARPA